MPEPITPPVQRPTDEPHIPRCLGCAYSLQGLGTAGRCPECGREFDLLDAATFTTHPPFVRRSYWLPGLLLAVGVGTALMAFLTFVIGSWTSGLWIGVPAAAGAVLGYGVRGGRVVLALLALGLVGGLVVGAVSLQLAGAFCGMALGVIFVIPVMFGVALGAAFRLMLKTTRFSQRWYLPVLVFAAVPVVWSAAEGRRTYAPEAVATARVVEASVHDCWEGLVFYEQVRHRPPLLLRIGLARPVSTQGPSRAVGDVRRCVYNRGWITKRVTVSEAPTLLAFEIAEQNIGYERDVRLTGGNFALEAIGPNQTRVTLTTQYEPKLGPRFAWRPAERLAVRILHGYVIEGIEAEAQRPLAVEVSGTARRPAAAEDRR